MSCNAASLNTLDDSGIVESISIRMTEKKKLLQRRESRSPGIAGTVLLTIRQLRPVVASPITIEGTVMRQDSDPRKEQPIIDAEITAIAGASRADVRTDSSGFFKLTLALEFCQANWSRLSFRHPDYLPSNIIELPEVKSTSSG